MYSVFFLFSWRSESIRHVTAYRYSLSEESLIRYFSSISMMASLEEASFGTHGRHKLKRPSRVESVMQGPDGKTAVDFSKTSNGLRSDPSLINLRRANSVMIFFVFVKKKSSFSCVLIFPPHIEEALRNYPRCILDKWILGVILLIVQFLPRHNVQNIYIFYFHHCR